MPHKPNVLVIDDEPGPRESLKILLKPEFDVTTTSRGSEALDLLREKAFEVVLVDLTMPDDLSGTETLRAIRSRDFDVEAIVITGQGTLDTAVECLRLGARDYIAKPFRANAVLGAVRGALGARATRRRADQVREQFLGNLSHEFRTPLNAIVGYSEILHDDPTNQLTPEGRAYLTRIQLNSERLLTYLEGLFFLAEFDSGGLALRPRTFAVRPWLERLLGPLRREATDRGVEITVDCGDSLVAHTDPGTLARLIGVLVFRGVAAGKPVHLAATPEPPQGIELTIEHRRDSSPAGGALATEAATSAPSGDDMASEVIDRAARSLGARTESVELLDGGVRVHVHVASCASDPTSKAGPALRGAAGKPPVVEARAH